jgi:hypothetical protein
MEATDVADWARQKFGIGDNETKLIRDKGLSGRRLAAMGTMSALDCITVLNSVWGLSPAAATDLATAVVQSG